MDNIFNKISISLIILGIAFYAFAMTFTALIPSILGLLMQVVLFFGRIFPKFHKHFAHVNVLILNAYRVLKKHQDLTEVHPLNVFLDFLQEL